MIATFSSVVAGWQTFYLLAGTASATLAGLIFVAVSANLDLVSESGVSALFILARRTLSSFILVVIIALIFVVPNEEPVRLGGALLTLGLIDVLQTILGGRDVMRELRQVEGWRSFANRIVRPLLMPVVTGLAIIFIAVTLLNGSTAYLYWMFPVIVLMLSNAALDAWELMLGLAQHKARRAAG